MTHSFKSTLLLTLIAPAALLAPTAPQAQATPRDCTPTRMTLAPPIGDETNLMRFFKRDTQLYFAETVIDGFLADKVPSEITSFEMGCFQDLRPSLRLAILQSGLNLSALNFWEMRKNLGLDFLASRGRRHPDLEVPETLAEFQAQTGFERWEGPLVENSRVKRLTRKIFHSPIGWKPRISVAQTHLTQDSNLNTPIRETEVLIERSPNSGQWDFYSYNSWGKLVPESEFKNGSVFPSPATCLACHYEPATRKFGPLLRTER